MRSVSVLRDAGTFSYPHPSFFAVFRVPHRTSQDSLPYLSPFASPPPINARCRTSFFFSSSHSLAILLQTSPFPVPGERTSDGPSRKNPPTPPSISFRPVLSSTPPSPRTAFDNFQGFCSYSRRVSCPDPRNEGAAEQMSPHLNSHVFLTSLSAGCLRVTLGQSIVATFPLFRNSFSRLLNHNFSSRGVRPNAFRTQTSSPPASPFRR